MSFIPKLFTPYKPRLIPQECIKGKVWVHQINRWGNKRTITRRDATIENVKGPIDADLYKTMREVHVNTSSSSSHGNTKLKEIAASATPQKPIRVTTYTIDYKTHSDKNMVVGLIESGDKKWVYRCCGGMPVFKFIDKERILQEAALNKKK